MLFAGTLVAGSWLTHRRRPHDVVLNHVGGVGSIDVRHPRPAAHPTVNSPPSDCLVISQILPLGWPILSEVEYEAQPVVGRQHRMPRSPIR